MEIVINVNTLRHPKTGLLVASSDELPGLFVHGRSEEELDERTPIAIRAILEASGEAVGEIVKLDDEMLAFKPTRHRYSAQQLVAA